MIESFSGVRGIYEKELTDDFATRYAYSYFELKQPKVLVLGRDSRKSGNKLRDAIIEGWDCIIIDVGVISTPAIQNAVREFNGDGGVIITASHNAKEFNGFKFLDKDGAVLRPKDMKKVIDLFQSVKDLPEDKFLVRYLDNEIKTVKIVEKRHGEALAAYIKFLKGFFNNHELKLMQNSRIKFTVDPNGGAGIIAKPILEAFGIKAEYINMEEGKFNRSIEPTEDALGKQEFHGFLAGFDCDADRLEIYENGLISGNHILALIVDDVLSEIKQPEEVTVVVNDATSYVVKDIVESYHAKWKEVEVGEINVVDTMIGFNSPVGGEGSSGGVIIPKSRCRDGILTLLYVLKILAKKKKTLRESVDEFEPYTYIQKKVNGKINREKVMKHYLDEGYTIQETGDETGGLKAVKDNGWIWFRESKTEENILRIVADSKDEKIAHELIREAKTLVQ